MERRREQNRLAQQRFRQKHRRRKLSAPREQCTEPSTGSTSGSLSQNQKPDTHPQTHPPSTSTLQARFPDVPCPCPATAAVPVAQTATPNNDEYHHSLESILFSNTNDIHSLGLDIEFSPATSSMAESVSTEADKTTEEILHRLEYNDPFIGVPATSSSSTSSTRDIVLPGSTRFTHALGSSPSQSPLHTAAQKGYGKIVHLLLRHNVDCDKRDCDGLTPLLHAIIGGHDDVVEVLLSHGASTRQVDYQHRSPLHLAVLYQQDRILKRLLPHCVGNSGMLNACTKDGKTPLHIAVDIGFEAAVEILLGFGADVR